MTKTSRRSWRSAPVKRLPRAVRLVPDETLRSYLARLAKANHLKSDDLRLHLAPDLTPTSRTAHTWLESLAIASGASIDVLCYALPELRDQHPALHLLSLRGRTIAGKPNTLGFACRRCMAARGIFTPVERWTRHEHNVCVRHQLWIGRGLVQADAQFSVAALPEIVRAQSWHLRLLRRHGRSWVYRAFLDADMIRSRWMAYKLWHTVAERRQRALTTQPLWRGHPATHAALYPEVVGLTSLLASIYWRQRTLTDDVHELDRFYAAVHSRVVPDYQPTGYRDHLVRWISDQRKLYDLAGLLDLVHTDTPRETIESTPWKA
ncbi:TniQ family protein [Nonomuraea sp. H19]|uniref:TniQ family protein n=1 Tax=Nonomuraea sp. H19 TaxID=3452206 RepID=UPI003F8B2504